jgi:hypothetical protein
MEHEPTLRIILEKPPAGVDFGVQKGKGNAYDTVQTQRSKGDDLRFEFTVRVKTDAGAPNFLGPFVHGPTGERFIYIDIGACAAQTNTPWSRRLKIPLKGITSDDIDAVLNDEDSLLETRIQGTGKDGGPTCGTVKPFAGWNVGKSKGR